MTSLFNQQDKLSKSQINKNYLAKKKTASNYEEYRKKRADAMRKYRLEKNNAENRLPSDEQEQIKTERRNAVRERVQKHRTKEKEKAKDDDEESQKSSAQSCSLSDMLSQSYSSNKTIGKAVAKVARAFPTSPRKKRAVLAKIISNMDDTEKNELVNVISPAEAKKRPYKDNFNVINGAIVQFLERDDISRASPKTRDVKSIKSPKTGIEVLMPTRHMILSLKEAFAIFIEERTKIKDGILFCVCFLKEAHFLEI